MPLAIRKKVAVVQIRMEQELKDEAMKHAKQLGITVTALMTMLLRKELAAAPPPSPSPPARRRSASRQKL
jgi:hypothetical protein